MYINTLGLEIPDLTDVEVGELLHSGKANDVLATTAPGVIAIRSTDRISAGNGAIKDTVPGKGLANHTVSVRIFELLEESNIPTHYLGENAPECIKFVQQATPVLLEVIGRFETAGSFCKHYGLPEELQFSPPGDKEAPFVEFTYKSDECGDPRITDFSIIKDGLLLAQEVNYVREMTQKAGKVFKKFFRGIGCNLIDFKIEFGRLPNGALVIIDEVSADTCRIRDIKTGQKLDKDPFREGELAETVRNGYAVLLERVERAFD